MEASAENLDDEEVVFNSERLAEVFVEELSTRRFCLNERAEGGIIETRSLRISSSVASSSSKSCDSVERDR